MPIIHSSTQAEVNLQVSYFGSISNLASQNFSLTNYKPFLIKNDGDDNVTLEVKPYKGSAWVETVFAPGWNPEIVKEIKSTANGGTLLWGY